MLAQTFTDYEVLIGDETGAFAPIVEQIADPRVDYRHNPQRLGFSRNHIALLDRAAGNTSAVLHDDDWWEPTYLSSMVAALEESPAIGLATCDIRRDVAGSRRAVRAWRVPFHPGRNDDVLDLLVREEWFLLPTCSMWRREVWHGAARQWPLDLHAADLQLFLSAAEEGWAFAYVPEQLAHWVQHTGQTASHMGGDYGLAVADDVLTFWKHWLCKRPEHLAQISRRQRANTELRRARALLLLGNRPDARASITRARKLAGPGGPAYVRLVVGVRLPMPLLHASLSVKRWVAHITGQLDG